MLSTPTDIVLEFRRPQAARPALKAGYANNGKSGGKSYRAVASLGTHTTLRCCVSGMAGKARKTAVYAPRRVPSCPGKSPCCREVLYDTVIEPAYFNGLLNMPVRRLHQSGER